MDNNNKGPARFGFGWWVKNILIAAAVYMLFPSLLKSNDGYSWLLQSYVRDNLISIRQLEGCDADQKLESRLGYDYAFVEMVRRMTPDSAVVYWPSRTDFTSKAEGCPYTFSVNLCDKLSAVRFLYPRRVVVEQEMGKTSWSRRLTHVAVVKGRNRELVPYATSQQMQLCVLPTDSVEAAKMFKGKQ